MYTVANLKADLTGPLHGTSLNKIQGLEVLIDRAARKIVADIDILETEKIELITNAVYQDVYDYPLPDDLKGDRVIDIRPQFNRTQQLDQFFQLFQKEFDLSKASNFRKGIFTIQFDNGQKSLRISKNVLQPTTVNLLDSLTGNGTWAVGGDATNLRVDTVNHVAGAASLRFDTTGAGTTAFLQNSTMTAVDLSRDLNQGSEFVSVFIPDPSLVTNFILQWGSSAAAYYTVTVTAPYNLTAFQTGWNLLRFDWNGATVVGAPDATAINFAQLLMTYDGTIDTDYRYNNLQSQLGQLFELVYYSKYLFRTTGTNVFKERTTVDTDILNLDTDAYNLMLNLVAYFCAQQIQGADSGFDAQFFLSEYENGKARYVAKNKSQIIKPQSTYYTMPTQNFARVRYSSS